MKSCIEILRDMRTDRDLKQSDIAKILGTTQQHYSSYEKGEYEVPTRVLETLADYYDVSVDYLLGRTDSTQGMAALNKPLTANCSTGRLLSDILALSDRGRQAVVDYVELQTLKEKA